MVGVQATTLGGVEALLDEALEVAGERLPVHLDLALDATPAERWRARAPRPERAVASVWAHAETAPRGLLSAARERGDLLSATGSGAAAALVRDVEVAWGSDAGEAGVEAAGIALRIEPRLPIRARAGHACQRPGPPTLSP